MVYNDKRIKHKSKEQSNMSKTKATIYGGGSFEKVATNGSVFLDKSMLIKEVLEDPFEVILITMPRRWGKSCNLEMIKTLPIYANRCKRRSKPIKENPLHTVSSMV